MPKRGIQGNQIGPNKAPPKGNAAHQEAAQEEQEKQVRQRQQPKGKVMGRVTGHF